MAWTAPAAGPAAPTGWYQQTNIPKYGNVTQLKDVAAVDRNTAWAVGYAQSGSNAYGIVYRTTDGGASWVRKYTFANDIFAERITALDANHAWVVGHDQANNGCIFLTTNGSSWSYKFKMSTVPLNGINRWGIAVTSLTPGVNVISERAMYWYNRGAGSDTTGGFTD